MSIYILPKIPYSKKDKVTVAKTKGSSVLISATVDSIQSIQFTTKPLIYLKLVGEDQRTIITLCEHKGEGKGHWVNERIIPT